MPERNGLDLPWARCVTVDWDKGAPPDWRRGRGDVGKAVRKAEALYERQSGTKGWHYVLVRRAERGGFSPSSKFQVRELLGDDTARLKFDRQRYSVGPRTKRGHRRVFRGDYATGVLFDVKDGRRAGDWRRLK